MSFSILTIPITQHQAYLSLLHCWRTGYFGYGDFGIDWQKGAPLVSLLAVASLVNMLAFAEGGLEVSCKSSLAFRSLAKSAHYRPQADFTQQKDNSDICSACGASGRLLCCDGCIRAFHFMCLDPPMLENAPPEGLWFCFNCEAKKDPYHRARRGLFSHLNTNLRKSNTSAFSLPKHTRDYYEGVATGDDGEYVDVPTSGKARQGFLFHFSLIC